MFVVVIVFVADVFLNIPFGMEREGADFCPRRGKDVGIVDGG